METLETLPESAYGPTAWESLPSLAVVPLVSQLVRQVNDAATRTIDGSGLSTSASLATLSPDGLWLKTQLAFSVFDTTEEAGNRPWGEYCATYPRWGMCAGGVLGALPMSAPRISAIESSSSDAAMWSTPTAQNATHGAATPGELRHRPDHLHVQVARTGSAWPTPKARDYMRSGSPSEQRRHNPDLPTVAKMWPSPTVADAEGGHLVVAGTSPTSRKPDGSKATVGLNQAVKWAAQQLWPTPTARDHKGAPGAGSRARGGRQASLPATLEDSAAKGRLNPRWVLQLMGLPSDWLDCAGPQVKARISGRGKKRGSS